MRGGAGGLLSPAAPPRFLSARWRGPGSALRRRGAGRCQHRAARRHGAASLAAAGGQPRRERRGRGSGGGGGGEGAARGKGDGVVVLGLAVGVLVAGGWVPALKLHRAHNPSLFLLFFPGHQSGKRLLPEVARFPCGSGTSPFIFV